MFTKEELRVLYISLEYAMAEFSPHSKAYSKYEAVQSKVISELALIAEKEKHEAMEQILPVSRVLEIEDEDVSNLLDIISEDPNTGLECDDCGNMKAYETIDPYAQEVDNEDVEMNLCNECYEQRERDV